MTDAGALAEDGKTQRFLDAEEAALKLVAGLERLDEQSHNYAAAAVQLSSAAEATRVLISAVEEVGSAARRALEVVASVGGPEVLSEVRATKDDLKAAQKKVEDVALAVAANDAGIKRVTQGIETLQEKAAEVSLGVAKNETGIRGAAQGIEVLGQKSDAVASGVAANDADIKGLAQVVEAISRRLELILYVAAASAILGLVAIVLNLVR